MICGWSKRFAIIVEKQLGQGRAHKLLFALSGLTRVREKWFSWRSSVVRWALMGIASSLIKGERMPKG